MSETGPCKRLGAGDSSLAIVASPTTAANLYDVEILDGPFLSKCYQLEPVETIAIRFALV